MTEGKQDSRRISWTIDVVTRLAVEKTFVEGGYVARSHVERACREAGVEKQRTKFLELLTRQGVLVQSDSGDYYIDPLRARQLVRAMKRDSQLSELSARERKEAITRLCKEAYERRTMRSLASSSRLPPLTCDLAIAFNVLRGMAKLHDGQYRVCVPAQLHEIDDAWLDEAFVPVTRRIDCVAGMELLLNNEELFRRIGVHQTHGRSRVVYAFTVNPHAVAVHLPDTAPVPRPVRARTSRVPPPPVEMRTAV